MTYALFHNGTRSDLVPPSEFAGDVAKATLLKGLVPAIDSMNKWARYNHHDRNVLIFTQQSGIQVDMRQIIEIISKWCQHVTNIADEYGLEELSDGWTIRQVGY